MRYTVVWTPRAEGLLTHLWVGADSAARRRITQAAREIDQQLARNAEQQGEFRAGRERILFAPPLGVLFEALTHDGLARIVLVWRTDRR